MKAEYDFSHAKRGAVLTNNGKTRITLYLDNPVLDAFKQRAQKEGLGYQTLINQSLLHLTKAPKPSPSAPLTAPVLRRILREELRTV